MSKNSKSSRSCPKGKIRVNSFKRKNSRVSSYCRKDTGAPGKTPASKRTLPEPGDEFSLGNMGYSVYLPKKERHDIVKRAGRRYGYLKVMRHLNLRANYQQWNQRAYNNMKADVDFLLGKVDIAVLGTQVLRIQDNEGIDSVGTFLKGLRKRLRSPCG